MSTNETKQIIANLRGWLAEAESDVARLKGNETAYLKQVSDWQAQCESIRAQNEELIAVLDLAELQLDRISSALLADARMVGGVSKRGASMRIDAVRTDIRSILAKVQA